MDTVYGAGGSMDEDVAALRRGFGAWADRPLDAEGYVDRIRSGRRLGRPR